MMLQALNYAKVSADKDGNPVLLNSETNVPRIISGNDVNGNHTRQTSRWVEDGSYLRLKNVSLSYNKQQKLEQLLLLKLDYICLQVM